MDKDILDRLYREYTKPVYLYLFSLCRNREQAEDMMQETFLRAFLSMDNSNKKMLAWLLKVAKNLYMDALRRDKKYEVTELHENITAKEMEMLDRLIEKEQNQRLYQAILKLHNPEREAVLLYYFGQLSQKEIAEIIGITHGSVRVILHRAKRKLYQMLNDNNDNR